jgi:hypothetical protein
LRGERVRYVVVYGTPQSKLWELVKSPEEFLAHKVSEIVLAACSTMSVKRKGAKGLFRLNALYYITKVSGGH